MYLQSFAGLLEDDDISEVITNIREDVADQCISNYLPPQSLEEQWDVEGQWHHYCRRMRCYSVGEASSGQAFQSN